MIELRVLGPVRVTGPARDVADAVIAQPKRLAVLAYLALSSQAPLVSRDELLGMFWPESDERRARESLRQSLRFLRRQLGSDALVTRGRGWVGVNRERIDCDAWRFEACLSSGDAAGALSLYGGELLHGLEVRGAAAFEQWLTERRREVARQAKAAAWQLAEEAREAGDAEQAIAQARRAREVDPADEESVRRLMGMHLWAGNRAGALRVYDDFEAWLAARFEAVPSVRTREMAERARGPVPAAPPAQAEATESEERGEAGERSEPGHPEPERAGPRISPPAMDPVAVPSRRRRGPAFAVGRGGFPGTAVAAGLLVAVLSGGLTASWFLRTPPVAAASPERQTERLLVMPFQVREADPSLGFLRHGMTELLGAVFTGDVGPEAVTWRARAAGRGSSTDGQDPIVLARRKNARWVVRGEVMGNERDVRISGTLLDTEGERAPVSTAVSGSADSVYALARELGSRLLAMERGYSEDEAGRLARTTPPALKAYLKGQEALRQTRFEEADRRFRKALRHDSLFAQAAVGLVEAHLSAPWLRGHISEHALPLAFRLQDRLGPSDREFVRAAAGPRYPGPSTHVEHLQAWERAVARAPDDAAIWYQWGDALYHVGPFIGVPNSLERAAAAFERTLALDPDYLLPLSHMIEMAAAEGDAERAGDLLNTLLERTAPDEPVNADYLRWRVALAAGDEEALAALRERFGEMSPGSLGAIVRAAAFLGDGLDDADLIARLDPNRWTAPAERWNLLTRFHAHALNRGRPSIARRLAHAVRDVAPTPNADLHFHVRAALGGGGDLLAAREAAAQLEAHIDLGRFSEQARRPGLVGDVCALEVWNLNKGDRSTARRTLHWLRDPGIHEDDPHERERCAIFIEALLTRVENPGRLPEAIARIQVLVDQGVQLPGAGYEPIWLFLAETLEQQGDLEGALRVIRRRSSTPFVLPEQLRIEGRLAARLGDTASARRAYAHYLALRSDPEPALYDEVLAVQDALVDLEPRLAGD